MSLDRRALVRGALGLPLVGAALDGAGRGSPAPGTRRGAAEPSEMRRPAGLIARQKDPENLEFPFWTLDGFLTPVEQFYVRTHFEVPELDPVRWRLSVEGEVARPLELTYDDLRRMPSRTVTALLECAGNGRVFLEPPQVGLRWELGGVGNAEWTGVALADVLERAGVKEGAVEVILEGADRGRYDAPLPKTPGTIPYARSLPMAKARRPEVLLAYRINGEALPPRHGFPVRAVVPGWYGMASVKWLRRIIVTDRPFRGYFQTIDYAIWERRHGLASLVPLTEIRVKAEVARPAPYEIVPRGTIYRMRGAAWAGESLVAKVEVSDDGGTTWAEAKLIGPPVPFAWRLWEHEWRVPSRPGRRILMARATDDRGRTQPPKRDPDLRDAAIHHVLPIDVAIR